MKDAEKVWRQASYRMVESLRGVVQNSARAGILALAGMFAACSEEAQNPLQHSGFETPITDLLPKQTDLKPINPENLIGFTPREELVLIEAVSVACSVLSRSPDSVDLRIAALLPTLKLVKAHPAEGQESTDAVWMSGEREMQILSALTQDSLRLPLVLMHEGEHALLDSHITAGAPLDYWRQKSAVEARTHLGDLRRNDLMADLIREKVANGEIDQNPYDAASRLAYLRLVRVNDELMRNFYGIRGVVCKIVQGTTDAIRPESLSPQQLADYERSEFFKVSEQLVSIVMSNPRDFKERLPAFRESCSRFAGLVNGAEQFKTIAPQISTGVSIALDCADKISTLQAEWDSAQKR